MYTTKTRPTHNTTNVSTLALIPLWNTVRVDKEHMPPSKSVVQKVYIGNVPMDHPPVMHVPMHHLLLYQLILQNGMSVTLIQNVYVIVTRQMGRIVGECNGKVG
jgi:hypothetical protein